MGARVLTVLGVAQAALRALTTSVEAHAHERRILVATLAVLQAREYSAVRVSTQGCG